MESSNFDLSVCYDRGTRFTIIGWRLYLRLPLLRGGSRVAGGEDEKTNTWLSCTRQGTIFSTKIDSFNYHYKPWVPCLVHDI